jgi:hypothetical protein
MKLGKNKKKSETHEKNMKVRETESGESEEKIEEALDLCDSDLKTIARLKKRNR